MSKTSLYVKKSHICLLVSYNHNYCLLFITHRLLCSNKNVLQYKGCAKKFVETVEKVMHTIRNLELFIIIIHITTL